MNATIGQNVKKLREARAWTQEQLAVVASVSARTIQRIETGEVPPSADTLLSLASALDVDVDTLRRTPEEQARLEAAAMEAIKKVEERYEIIRLVRIERASRLTSFLSSTNALLCEHVELANDAEEDAVDALEGLVRECLDFWSDMPECHRSTERDLQQIVERLAELKLVVAAGTHSRRVKLAQGDPTPFTFDVLYVMISRETDQKLFIALDKKAPVRLG